MLFLKRTLGFHITPILALQPSSLNVLSHSPALFVAFPLLWPSVPVGVTCTVGAPGSSDLQCKFERPHPRPYSSHGILTGSSAFLYVS